MASCRGCKACRGIEAGRGGRIVRGPDEFGALVSIRALPHPEGWMAIGELSAAGGEMNQGKPVPACGAASAAVRGRVCGVLADNEELADRRCAGLASMMIARRIAVAIGPWDAISQDEWRRGILPDRTRVASGDRELRHCDSASSPSLPDLSARF
jgi:hypothetical protein